MFKPRVVEEKVMNLAEPVALELGLEVVDVEFVCEHGWILRVYIDSPKGITVDDCGRLSRELSALLDVEDCISGRYSLEVSSPGLDRPLKRPKDFVAAVGKKVKVKTKIALEGRKNFKAAIESASDDGVTLKDSEGRLWKLEYSNIEKARLEIEL
ncbi:MAG: ribosome maturation factor RimP [Deltaproteobacteria bacterium]|nr:ribosome maturation factor RimP [Deltaproteobacteria bacterium]